ncbi:OST-HTH/LOTUS domain-containing protein [Ramlibacter sp. XY19]|uniref:OST-HTH/LOTUS domain-containing protein n=1 Tax=Ramlibacter paludis TaxID=2908000 RepID=UPI0023DCC698|nr:OST-HTH/LOTUS domain-containing protein [Ramlibacter paludis]MCG2593024.1 OST-HTH/LOTUS domain-containing protein [Ramlibacter paludis]
MAATLGNEDPRPELQLGVQRLLGRCLLRIQQYERLLKALLAHHELAGPVDTLQAQREERTDKLSDKSLGALVKALFETYVVPSGFERDLLPDGKAATDRIAMAFSFRIEMAPEDRSKTKAALEELVDLRNQLVHHLIERFDVWSEEGCVDAARHLEERYARIDRHYLELTAWAKAMDETRSMAAQVTQAPAFLEMLVNGVAPDGSFEWPHTGIVRVLREATEQLTEGGWTRLDLARAWIAKTHPDQVPEKYGCRTWPQVLSESRQFDLQYRPEGDGTKTAWFRERAFSP